MKRNTSKQVFEQRHLLQAGQRKANYRENAFTLTELIISVVILGILSSVAIPKFFGQLQRTCQNEAANKLNLLANSASAYKDIYGVAPTTWGDLNDISAVMTTTGPASTDRFTSKLDAEGNETNPNAGQGGLTNGIITSSCDYKLSKSSQSSGDKFIFIALPPPYTEEAPFTEKDMYNVVSCFDLSNGASDLKKGNYSPSTPDGVLTPAPNAEPRLQKDIEGPAKTSDLAC